MRNRRSARNIVSIVSVFVGMTLLAAGCGGRAGGGSGTTAPGGAQGTAASQPQGGGEKQATDEKGEIIKLGISAPMSGAAASWGKTMEWVAKEAAKKVNAEGGVQADGKRYMFEVVAYDNKYTAAEGTKVAQTMVNRDKVKFVVGAVGSAPVLAMQSVTEPAKVIMFSTAWSREARGPEKPYTFTSLNTPVEVMEPLYSWILQNHKDLKTVAILNPKDATGTDTMAVSEATWKRHGIQILAQEYYERGTTEFYPIVTKLIQRKPDIIDLGATPPGDAGLIFKALGEQGWNGVKIVGAGTSSSELIKAAGRAADGVYLGLAPDFTGPTATPLQRDLETRAVKEIGEHLSAISISAWDAVMALKAAIEKAGTLDPDKLKDTIPNIVFESSYGPAAFGGAAYYKSVQQMLLPVTVTQIQGDKTVEVARVIPEELKQKVGAR